MFKTHYDIKRFSYIHEALNQAGIFTHSGSERLKKTACFYSDNLNIYIDTSDGVNEDLKINEYCARILKVIDECSGKKFLFFKAAYSPCWSKNIINLAEKNNGKIIPFFKWPFNANFNQHIFKKRNKILDQSGKKEYDIGYFCGLKPYDYPKPSTLNPLISWSDHEKFNLPGKSKNTGNYLNYSRKNIYEKIIKSNFKVLYKEKISYKEYINESLKCKTVINPPGVGEYTSRMFDQCYLGNCVVLRKNSYDQGHSWKQYLPEVDFGKDSWQEDYQKILENYEQWGNKALYYYEKFWTPQAIVQYLIENMGIQ